MKKKLSLLLAGVFGAAAICGIVACGKGGDDRDDSKYDKQATAFSSADVTYNLDGRTDKTEPTSIISDTLFGVFLEDINYASYALTSNLVANGSFEALTGKGKDHAWKASGATLTVEKTDGIFKNTDYGSVNPNYAKVQVTSAGGKIINEGYPSVPMAVEKDVNYVFSAFIKAPGALNMTVSVTDGTTVYASETIPLLAKDSWVKYTRTLKANATGRENLKLEISFDTVTTVYLDGVSLDTLNATVGVKNYIYNAIKDLSPKFIRFPGGCVIEGTDITEAYDWKNSIGAVALSDGTDKVPAFTYEVNTDGTIKNGEATYGEAVTRKPNKDIWYGATYYDMEYTVGFYEYFLLCESVGASAVPVISCGLSDQGGIASIKGKPAAVMSGRHGNKVEDYIQDAKDLIAFAKGSTTSSDPNEAYWAGIREKMGHKDPFDLQYLGIGNEQWGNDYYNKCYEKFLEAFKADDNDLYRSVKPIVGNAMTFGDCENPAKRTTGRAQAAAQSYLNNGKIDAISEYGVHDQHYYMNYANFFTNTYLYDDYKNSASENSYYEVFVGEYSANSVTSGGAAYSKRDGNLEWANSWITALSEAAMMTGYERNGDVIRLAAYAPMFAPVSPDERQWSVDMMYFTNTELICSANYYVQQLFMQNQGRYKLLYSNYDYADGFETTCPLYGLGTKGTQVTGITEIDKLYYVASMAENGDLILKIVNAGADPVKLNVKLSNANVRTLAEVTTLSNESLMAVNTMAETGISPKKTTIGGWTDDTLGYEAEGYSVTCIRVLAK